MVSAISAADKSFSFKSGNSPILEWVPNYLTINNLKMLAKDSCDMFIDFTSSEAKIFEFKIMSTFEYYIPIYIKHSIAKWNITLFFKKKKATSF